MSTQRKNAEKTTEDVHAILEAHGISDASEEYYSSSDNDETPGALKKANGYEKAGESSCSSNHVGNESEDIIPLPKWTLPLTLVEACLGKAINILHHLLKSIRKLQ